MPKTLYATNKQGELIFTETDSRRHNYKSDSFFSSLPFQLLILIVCAVTDFASFNQMFAILLYDSQVMRWLAVVGMLVAFEIIPIVAANNLKKQTSGYKSSPALTIILIAIFLCGVALNFYLRYTTRDTVFPNLDSYTRSMFGNGYIAVEMTNPNALPLSLFFGLLPVFTSVVSFGCAYMLFNPLQKEKQNLEKDYALLTNEVNRYLAIIQEYDADANFKERILEGDDAQYEAARARSAGQANYLKNYTRQRIKEHLATPAAISELSLAPEIKYVLAPHQVNPRPRNVRSGLRRKV
jgi:hypothetical protein